MSREQRTKLRAETARIEKFLRKVGVAYGREEMEKTRTQIYNSRPELYKGALI